jgi:enamine deaminase RidA (YjgF/YER057c/UK114 family)
VERPLSTPHQLLNPPSLPRPSGYTHAVVTAAGRGIYLAGQTGRLADGRIAETLAEQFDGAAENVEKALAAAGARPEHLVSIQIFTTDIADYRASLAPIGAAYRKHFGQHYPAVSLFEVSALFDADACVELVCIAHIPDTRYPPRPGGGAVPARPAP